jgi:FtsZ-interacting cell division protein ZipA
MDTWVWIVIAVVAVVVLLAVLWSATRTRRSRSLQDRFGHEYDRTVEHAGDKREAERELRDREKRHEQLDLRPLAPEQRARYVDEWQVTQGRFVDDPSGAVAEADRLVQRVMKDRGYPVDDFEQRAADISVEHPELVEKYRTAHGVAQKSERGQASTEDLRHSVRHYRAVFAELLEVRDEDEVENVDEVATRNGDDESAPEREADRVQRLR